MKAQEKPKEFPTVPVQPEVVPEKIIPEREGPPEHPVKIVPEELPPKDRPNENKP
jgi:hypothetical protein